MLRFENMLTLLLSWNSFSSEVIAIFVFDKGRAASYID